MCLAEPTNMDLPPMVSWNWELHWKTGAASCIIGAWRLWMHSRPGLLSFQRSNHLLLSLQIKDLIWLTRVCQILRAASKCARSEGKTNAAEKGKKKQLSSPPFLYCNLALFQAQREDKEVTDQNKWLSCYQTTTPLWLSKPASGRGSREQAAVRFCQLHIVSRPFDGETQNRTLSNDSHGKKVWKTEERQKNNMWAEADGNTDAHTRNTHRYAQAHAFFFFFFISVRQITFIKPDLELHPWPARALMQRLFPFLFMLWMQVVVQR